MGGHPVRLLISDDLRRSRLTVFFRVLLAIPHFLWLALWTAAVLPAAFVNWIATLIERQPPLPLHNFFSSYIRYQTHVNAYVLLAANPFPGFLGHAGTYPIDVALGPPEVQSRKSVGFRIFLAIPALMVVGSLVGAGAVGSARSGGSFAAYGGAAWTIAFLGWFASLVRGRMPRGFRDLLAYALRYSAQVDAYLFMVTGRYPDSNPVVEVPDPPPDHPVTVSVNEGLRRSRLTVFFRFPLTFPHFFWLFLWTIPAFLAIFANWLVTLIRGRPPAALHRFISAYLRYQLHVFAFLYLVANPFPGFVGREGSYPVDLHLPGPERQSRWVTGFRGLLAIPAFLASSAIGGLLYVVAFLGWFAGLFTARMPEGLRNLGAYALRYSAQANAYAWVLTERYPYSGPPVESPPAVEEPALAAAA